MASQDNVISVIGNIESQARSSARQAEGFARTAINIPRISISGSSGPGTISGGSSGYRLNLALYDPAQPDVDVPPFSPDIDLGELLDIASDGNITLFIDKLSVEFTRFVNSYFPDYGVYESDLRARVQEMLSGNRMLPLPIENAIFERGRSRITKDYLSLTQSVSSEMAARGFTLPDGTLAARLDEAKFAGHSATAGFSRDVAIRQAEIAIDNLRFAMDMAYKHRFDAISAAIQYVQSVIVSVLDKGVEKARLIVEAKRALWDSTTTYYNTLIRNGEMLLRYEDLVASNAVERARLTLQALTNDTQRYTEGAIAGAQSMAKVAGDALSSLNTLASIVHETSVAEESA